MNHSSNVSKTLSRPKSTAADTAENDGYTMADSPLNLTELKAEILTEEDLNDPVIDFSDKTKSGTPSPWAVFDAWGAGDQIHAPLDPSDEAMLAPESVRIPTSEEERDNASDETAILAAYDNLLKSRSSVHFGYPYNLMYNHEELYQFMKYSINNLGDPFVPSNYGVHSRQFECSVIDFFSNLWNITPVSIGVT